MSTLEQLQPKIVTYDDAKKIASEYDQTLIQLSSADTGGQFYVTEVTTQPGFGPPLHVHSLEDEIFIVHEGQVEFTIVDKKHVVGPGTVVFGPRSTPHTFKGAGDGPSRFTVIATGENFEKFYARYGAEMAKPSPDFEVIGQIAAEHGIRFVV